MNQNAAAVHKTLKYRKDFDGLRAVALIVGIGFHTFPEDTFRSGYAVAEVFFVLSGFLISSTIYKKLDSDSFSFKDFYSHRVNRLFPSLLVLLFTMLIVSWFTLLSHELSGLSKHFMSGSFLSNFVFANQSSYFHVASFQKPLIHLWSFSIEEQFYLCFPFFLWLVHRSRLNRDVILVIAIVVFFIITVLGSSDNPTASYFLPQTRVWPLLTGALLGSVYQRLPASWWDTEHSKTWSAISIFSFAAILLSSYFTPVSETYPGAWGMTSTFATVLLISCGSESFVNRTILSHPVMVFLGVISYPYYLFHWPIIAFGNIFEGGHSTALYRAGATAAALVIGWLLYKYLELPNRVRGPSKWKTRVLVGALVVVMISGFTMRTLDGVPDRAVAIRGKAITEAMTDWDWPPTEFVNAKIVIKPLHLFEGQTSKKTLFVGDSLMGQYYPLVRKLYEGYPRPQLSTIFAPRYSCPPLPLKGLICEDEGIKCIDYYNEALKLAGASDIHTVVFSGDWRELKTKEIYDQFFSDVSKLVSIGKRVFIIALSPEGRSIDPLSASKYVRFSDRVNVSASVPRRTLEHTSILEKMKEYATASGAILINPFDYVCSTEECPFLVDGQPLYRDWSHFRRSTVLREDKPFPYISQMINLPAPNSEESEDAGTIAAGAER